MTDFTFITYAGGSAIALFAGFLTGIFGVGGGFLMTPALMILLGIPGNIAVGTDLVVIFVNSSFGMFKRRRTDTVDIKLGLCLAAGGIGGAKVGIIIMELLKDMPPLVVFGREQVAVQYILLWLFLFLLVWIAGFMTFDLRRSKDSSNEARRVLFSKIKIPPYVNFKSLDETQTSIVPIIGFGFSVGVLTGLMGVGGGIVMLPVLVYLVGQRTAKAAGTSLLFVWVVSMLAGTDHIIHGNIKPLLLAGMLVGGIIGTNFGTLVGLKLAGRRIRLYFVYVVILAIAMVAFKLFRMTFA